MTNIYFIDPTIEINEEFSLSIKSSLDGNVILLFLVSENSCGKFNMTKYYDENYLNCQNLTFFPISISCTNSIKGIFGMLYALFVCGILVRINNKIIFNTNFANYDLLNTSFINLTRYQLVKLDHKIKLKTYILTKLGVFVLASYVVISKATNNFSKVKLLFFRRVK